MKRHLYAIALVSLGLVSISQPAMARPEIASGDQLLNTDVDGCLARAEQLITTLGVESDQGSIDRTGYFEDGSFRVLCYEAGEASRCLSSRFSLTSCNGARYGEPRCTKFRGKQPLRGKQPFAPTRRCWRP